MAVSREWLVSLLRSLGYTHAAEEAERSLPETMEMDRVKEFGDQHGISLSDLEDRMGGSP